MLHQKIIWDIYIKDDGFILEKISKYNCILNKHAILFFDNISTPSFTVTTKWKKIIINQNMFNTVFD